MFGRFVIILLTVASFAQADPCDKDRALTCNDISAGDGRVHDCLIGRREKLQPACAQALDRADQLVAAIKETCTTEVQRWCAQYTGDGRNAVIDCLKMHKDAIKPECKSKYRQFQAFGFDIKS